MKTESIQIVGNKPQFRNYLTDPIILKPDSSICLNKASFGYNIYVDRYVVNVSGINPVDVILKASLNGIEKDITYQDIYDAWNAEASIDNLETATIAEFYGGKFEFVFGDLKQYLDMNTGLNLE